MLGYRPYLVLLFHGCPSYPKQRSDKTRLWIWVRQSLCLKRNLKWPRYFFFSNCHILWSFLGKLSVGFWMRINFIKLFLAGLENSCPVAIAEVPFWASLEGTRRSLTPSKGLFTIGHDHIPENTDMGIGTNKMATTLGKLLPSEFHVPHLYHERVETGQRFSALAAY